MARQPRHRRRRKRRWRRPRLGSTDAFSENPSLAITTIPRRTGGSPASTTVPAAGPSTSKPFTTRTITRICEPAGGLFGGQPAGVRVPMMAVDRADAECRGLDGCSWWPGPAGRGGRDLLTTRRRCERFVCRWAAVTGLKAPLTRAAWRRRRVTGGLRAGTRVRMNRRPVGL